MINHNIKILFLHLQGIVLIPTLNALFSSNVSKYFVSKNKFKISNFAQITDINAGYLNVSLRMLRSSNLLKYNLVGNEL